jgi:hypothetical protein
MTNRRLTALRPLVETGLQAVALISLVRRIGPRRFGRIAALATEGYLVDARRGVDVGTAERRCVDTRRQPTADPNVWSADARRRW